MKRREFLAVAGGALVGAAAVVAAPVAAPPKRYGSVYHYGRIEIEPNRDVYDAYEEFRYLRKDFKKFMLKKFETDDWSGDGIPEDKCIIQNGFIVNPDPLFLDNQQRRVFGRSRYYQPLHYGWVDCDGQTFTRDRGTSNLSATMFLYGRVQSDPGTWECSEASLDHVLDQLGEQLWRRGAQQLGYSTLHLDINGRPTS